MAGTITLLVVASSLISAVCSDIMKIKSNPDGNFAIGLEYGYINNGRYGVIVPKGESDDKREVQIRAKGVRDSVYMDFNPRTIVFSDWKGMFMLGDRVYTDTMGTLYFFRSDHKCVKKVYNIQMGEVQVVDKDTLEKGVCESMRTKVEKALTHYLTTPFKYLLPNAPLKLQKAQGFPGGDFVQGVSFGTIHCGQHAVELPPGDATKARTIKVTAPGISEEIKMVFDTETKIFGSWDGSFFMGDKVFSVEPRVLVIRKDDGSCVKKKYSTVGGEIVAQPQLIKAEDCFLIKSKVYAAMQQLIKPSTIVYEERKKNAKQANNNLKPQQQAAKNKGIIKETPLTLQVVQKIPQKAPPPIHVTNTVVLPKPALSEAQLVPVVSNPGVVTTVAAVKPGQIVSVHHDAPPQPQQILTVSPSEFKLLQQQTALGTLPTNLFVQPVTTTLPSSTYLVQRQTTPPQIQVVQAAAATTPNVLQAVPLPSSTVFNKQQNDVSLTPSTSSVLMQGIDPTQQVVVPAGYVRVGRSIAQDSQPENVINTQETNIAASAITKAREGTQPTNIVGVQQSSILSPKGLDGLSLMPDMKATQITTVTIHPNNPVKQTISPRPQPIILKTIPSPAQKVTIVPSPNTVFLQPKLVQKVRESPPPVKVVNLQKNNVQLGEGKVLNVQNNFINLQSPYQLAKNYIVDPVKKLLFSSSSEPSKVINIQDNQPIINGPGEVENIQTNVVKIPNDPVLLENTSPNVLVRVGRSITGSRRIVNLQDNVNTVEGVGEITNVQKNNGVIRESNTPLVVKEDSPIVLVRGKRRIPDYVLLQKLQEPQQSKIENLQDNVNAIEGQGEVNNIQSNRGDINVSDNAIMADNISPNTVVPVAVSMPGGVYGKQVYSPKPSTIFNQQDNKNSIEGYGQIKNIQNNRGEINSGNLPSLADVVQPKLFVQPVRGVANNRIREQLQGPPLKSLFNLQDNYNTIDESGEIKNIQKNRGDIVDPIANFGLQNEPPKVLVRVDRSIAPENGQQDILNKQIVNVLGSTVSSQPDGVPIVSVQRNGVVAPVGPDGLPVVPNMQASQVTKLTIPPPQGAPKGQAPQQVFIKSNVLMDPNSVQQTQNTPLYIQRSPTTVAPGPTILSLFPTTTSTPTIVSVPSTTIQPAVGTVRTIQRSDIIQNQPYIATSQAVRPSALKMGQYIIVPAKSENDATVHIFSSGGGGSSPVITATSGQTGHTVIVNSPPSPKGQIPVSLMKDLTMLKQVYNPTNMIVNIAQNTNFHKLK